MIKNLSELRKLIQFARKSGLDSVKCGNVEFKFKAVDQKTQDEITAARRSVSQSIPVMGNAVQSFLEGERPPSEDELLYASTDYFDLLRADREKATKPPETERN